MNPFLNLSIPVQTFNGEVQKKLAIWTDPLWSQDEYILEYNKAGYIDPAVGWALTLRHKLIYPSLGFSQAPYVKKPSFFQVYFSKGNIIELADVISLRDTGEENYFHFFNDVITKVYLLREAGFDCKRYTIVISKRLYDKQYFQVLVQLAWWRDLKWYVQDYEWVSFKQAVFCKPMTHRAEYLKEIVAVLRPTLSLKNRRVFLTRGPATLRFIENIDDLIPVLSEHSFEIVDTAEMSFKDQVRLFSECRFLIGIHGAGLTNMIFRFGCPLSMIEIAHPFTYLPFHYIMMAKQFDFSYNVVLGTKSSKANTGGFRLNASTLDDAIRKML